MAIILLTIHCPQLLTSASGSLQPPLRDMCITVNPCWVEAMIVGLFVPAETECIREAILTSTAFLSHLPGLPDLLLDHMNIASHPSQLPPVFWH